MAPASIIVAACLFFLQLSFLPHLVAAASPPLSFSFDFSNTSKYRLQDLRFEGDAALNGDLVDLTCNPIAYYCSGRMSYSHPVPFYDNTTGEVTSFVTTFTFSMNMQPNTTKKGDGMSFFLAGYPSRLPPKSHSSLLGLTNSSTNISTGADRFLAVEFDTYGNSGWDPTRSRDHMGIDLNSITSVSITRLPEYSFNGTMTATITFDNTTRTLEATLHFDSNSSLATASVKTQLSDQLDALLPPVVAVGFSASSGGDAELHQIHSWSFNSTMASRERSSGATNKFSPGQSQMVDNKGRHIREYIMGGAVTLALALFAIWWIVAWYRWKRTRAHFGNDSGITRFHYRDLSAATNKFSEKIGEGGFSVVYSGILNEHKVAVKNIVKDSKGDFKDSKGEYKDFLAERATIAQTRHMNVVKLEGWCCSISNFKFWFSHTLEDVNLFLVYEFVANGTLHDHLYEKQVLSWEKRYKIVKGLCSALHYLHHQCSKVILHRDIKPGNILLDNYFNAKLGDFGLSRVIQDISKRSLETSAVGTELYMDPLCMRHGKIEFDPSSDVYSVGIVLLEIVHGKYDMDRFRKLRTDRPETFANDFADQKLEGKFDKGQMERVILLGLQCSEPADASKRPSLDGAILPYLDTGGVLRPAAPAPAMLVSSRQQP